MPELPYLQTQVRPQTPLPTLHPARPSESSSSAGFALKIDEQKTGLCVYEVDEPVSRKDVDELQKEGVAVVVVVEQT